MINTKQKSWIFSFTLDIFFFGVKTLDIYRQTKSDMAPRILI